VHVITSASMRSTLLAISFVLCPALARAAETPDKAVCVDAYEAGQPARAAGRLLEARERFLACAADPCPPAMREECTRWVAEVETEIPTVVVVAREGGREIAGARILVDDRELPPRPTGTAISVDPGERRFRVERAPGDAIERTEIFHVGEKLRVVVVDFPPPVAITHRPRWPGYALLGVGAAGALSFGYFGISGLVRYKHLESTCAPACDVADRDDVRTRFLVADISLGVSALALGGAAWWLLGRDAPVDVRGAAPAVSVRVAPMAGGAGAAISGEF
jgi:hypothetical protein